MKLAMKLGRTMDELQQTMTGEEFAWWLALYRREPWDEWPGYFQAGVVASTIANYAGKMRGKNVRDALPNDYMGPMRTNRDAVEIEESPDPAAHFQELLNVQPR